VGVASTVEETEQRVRSLFPDAVLMDIRLPHVDGIEGTRRVRRASPSTKVIILTVSDDELDVYAALKAGACAYMTKDKRPEEIAHCICAALGNSLIIPSHLAGRFLHDLEEESLSGIRLNDVEKEILTGIANGLKNRELAAQLHLSARSLSRRLEDVYSKLHLKDRIEAAVYGSRLGLRELSPRSAE
jgi:NarL family two-component system response regulator LiaR